MGGTGKLLGVLLLGEPDAGPPYVRGVSLTKASTSTAAKLGTSVGTGEKLCLIEEGGNRFFRSSWGNGPAALPCRTLSMVSKRLTRLARKSASKCNRPIPAERQRSRSPFMACAVKGNDGKVLTGGCLFGADRRSGLESIFVGHLDIHQDDIEPFVVRWLREPRSRRLRRSHRSLFFSSKCEARVWFTRLSSARRTWRSAPFLANDVRRYLGEGIGRGLAQRRRDPLPEVPLD